MMITIKDKKIGENYPCFIIAEAGVNHNGKLELAKELVDVAVNAGADAVKFQTYKSEGVTTDTADSAAYIKKNLNTAQKQINILQQYELDYDDFITLKHYCDKKNILFLSTPHSFDAIDFLNDLVPVYKFGSGDLTNIPALQYAAKKGKPLILGTGMATLKEIQFAVEMIKETGNTDIILLHCTTNYPCPTDEVHMNAMITMQKEFDCLIGYSDHTSGITISLMARTLGAHVIEKHFTVNKTLPGPDHKASLEPFELKEMIDNIRTIENAFGSHIKQPTQSELQIKDIVRKSLVAIENIEKNTKLTREMIAIKRPGTGIPPYKLSEIIDKKTKKPLKKNELLTDDILR